MILNETEIKCKKTKLVFSSDSYCSRFFTSVSVLLAKKEKKTNIFSACVCFPHSHGPQLTHQWRWALVGTGPISSFWSPFPGPPLCFALPPLDPPPVEHCTAPSHGSSLHTNNTMYDREKQEYGASNLHTN